ncbi:MAG: BatA domain-containing protein [Verrucomicrobiota bacterium]
MTWLFPLYLLGAAAIIGPILMHLRRRPPQDRVEFSSLMFLDAQTPMPVSKRKLDHWLLLLLRCLALLLLALMFARPLLRVENEAPLFQQSATIILLDSSASMRRGDLWKQAVDIASERLQKVAVTDRLAVATLDRQTQLLWSFDQDRGAASTRVATLKPQLSALKPSWESTDLGQALVDAAGWFGSAQGLSGLQKRILLVSDLQEGAKLEALRSLVWPENIQVEVMRVEVPNADNFTLSLAASSPEESAGKDKAPKQTEAVTRVRISNARESKISDFNLDSTPVTSGYIAPGSSRVVTVPALTQAEGSTLTVTGDAWDFDNRVYIAPAQPKTVKIVFIGDEKTRDEAASPLFYLSRALQPTASLRPELSVIAATATALPPDTQLVFVSGARLNAPLAQSVRALVEKDGLVVSVIAEPTTPQDLEALTGIGAKDWNLSASREEGSESYSMLADVQTAHPLLRPFADERLRDFTKLRFWHHRKVTLPKESPLEVLARFDNGDPAILGKGRLILLTSGWHPADSQLALSTKFVPLLYGWLEAAGFRNEQAASLLVGDVLPLDGATTIMTPDGQTLTPKPGTIPRAEMPGIYRVGKELRAVNLPPEEGRITPMDVAKLRELGVRVEDGGLKGAISTLAEEKERLAITEQEGRQRAWIWLLGALLVILGWETWLAGRIRQSVPQQAFTPA